MAVTITNRTQINYTMWQITYESNLPSPTFYIWIDGVLQASTPETTWFVSVSVGASVQVDIFDDSGDSPEVVLPNSVYIQWDPVSGAAAYAVQEYVVDTWITKSTILDRGAGQILSYQSSVLDDDTEYQYQVLSYDAAGQAGAAVAFTFHMVHYPPATPVDMAFNFGGTVTITEA